MDKTELLQKIKEAAKDNIEVLNLFGNQLTALPPEIGLLTNLRELYLGRNQLTSLPTEIGQLTNLRELHLEGNQLTSLPTEIGQLTNLRELCLGRNQLTTLPAEIGQLTNLRELYLEGNKLTTLPVTIGLLSDLTILYIYDNKLTTLPTQIRELTNLLVLKLINDQRKNPPPAIVKQGFDAIMDYLNQTSGSITSMVLEDHKMPDIFNVSDEILGIAKHVLGYKKQNQLKLIIDPGTAPPEFVADFLSDISILYRMKGGSGINFTIENVGTLHGA